MQHKLLADITANKDNTILDAFLKDRDILRFVDGHIHLFRAASGTPNLLILRLLLNQTVSRSVERFFGDLNPFSDRDLGNRLANYLMRSNQPSGEILANWRSVYHNFCLTQRCSTDALAAATLIIDMETPYKHLLKNDHPTLYPFVKQLQEVSDLAKQPANFGRVLPFLGIDPRREDLYQTITNALGSGYVGGKVYPSLGFLPSDPRVIPVWSAFENLGIPVVVHCSNVGIFSFETTLHLQGDIYTEKTAQFDSIDGDQKFWFWDSLLDKNVRSWQYLNSPELWLPVLAQFPKLKLCFAHMGGKGAIQKHIAGNHSWTSTILKLMQTYDNVYGDISYVSRYRELNSYFRGLIESNEIFRNKLILASDFPLNELIADSSQAANGMVADFAGHIPTLGVSNFIDFISPR